MIDLYTFSTPNGRKASIMLEEVGLPYTVHPVNIGKGEQFAPDFLKISPNNKIPAIVDNDAPGGPVSVFESGAILIYLAEKAGSALLPSDPAHRAKVLEWLMWQMGGLGPMLGQMGHFVAAATEEVPYGITRYTGEAARLLGVLDRQLADQNYVAGAACSIADIAIYPWIKAIGFYAGKAKAPLDLPATPHIDRWVADLAERPAVKKGMAIPAL